MPSASTRRPGAWMPSSFVIKIFGMETSLWNKRAAARRSLPAEEKWSGRLDLNQRPHAPQACALPGCATSRPHGHHIAQFYRAVASVSLAFEEGQDGAKLF